MLGSVEDIDESGDRVWKLKEGWIVKTPLHFLLTLVTEIMM